MQKIDLKENEKIKLIIQKYFSNFLNLDLTLKDNFKLIELHNTFQEYLAQFLLYQIKEEEFRFISIIYLSIKKSFLNDYNSTIYVINFNDKFKMFCELVQSSNNYDDNTRCLLENLINNWMNLQDTFQLIDNYLNSENDLISHYLIAVLNEKIDLINSIMKTLGECTSKKTWLEYFEIACKLLTDIFKDILNLNNILVKKSTKLKKKEKLLDEI